MPAGVRLGPRSAFALARWFQPTAGESLGWVGSRFPVKCPREDPSFISASSLGGALVLCAPRRRQGTVANPTLLSVLGLGRPEGRVLLTSELTGCSGSSCGLLDNAKTALYCNTQELTGTIGRLYLAAAGNCSPFPGSALRRGLFLLPSRRYSTASTIVHNINIVIISQYSR